MRMYFFDSKLVVDTVEKGARRALSKFGAYVRTTARQSLRKATKNKPISKPGEPPRMHVGTPKRLLFFAYDQNSKSVVVGSMKTKEGKVLKTLEYGGASYVEPKQTKIRIFKIGDWGCIRLRDPNAKKIRDKFYWTKLKTPKQVNRANQLYAAHVQSPFNNGSRIRVKIKARPYMRPAFRKNLTHAKLAKCFLNCTRK